MQRLIKIVQRPNIKLSWKLLGGFGAAGLLLLIALGFAVVTLFSSIGEIGNLKGSNDRSTQVAQIEILQNRLVRSTLDYLWSGNLNRLNDYEVAKHGLSTILGSFQPSAIQKNILAQLTRQLTSLEGLLDQMQSQADTASTNNQTQAGEVAAKGLWQGEGSKQAAQVRSLVEDLSQQELHRSEVSYEQSIAQINNAIWLVSGLVIVAVLVAVCLALLITAAVTSPLTAMRNRLTHLAEGDLTELVAIANRDEIGDLGTTFNATVVALRNLVIQLHTQSQQMSTTTEELTTQSKGQVAAISQQSNAIVEATQSLQELKETAGQIALQASSASRIVTQSVEQVQAVSQLADEMAQAQEQGRVAVSRTLLALARVKEQVVAIQEQQEILVKQSNVIEDVTTFLGAIAKETHLLALNAAIEAAGAGAWGERFGVIAKEVKHLSSRAGDATQRVSEALNEVGVSVEKVSQMVVIGLRETEGAVAEAQYSDKTLVALTALSQQVRVASRSIVTEVEGSALLTDRITAATHQQQVANNQMLQTMLEIEAVTMQNLNAVKQGEVAAYQLGITAQELKAAAGAFKLVA